LFSFFLFKNVVAIIAILLQAGMVVTANMNALTGDVWQRMAEKTLKMTFREG
jgi:hypothetical protein